MDLINLKNNIEFLKEYFFLCSKEWGEVKTCEEMKEYVNKKVEKVLSGNYDKLISAIGLIDNNILIGFISLFKCDGEERRDLTPWYATMYVKKEYRGLGYSKILNDAILNEARRLNYNKVYLKSDLINYYEKFGAKYIETLNDGESLYYIEL